MSSNRTTEASYTLTSQQALKPGKTYRIPNESWRVGGDGADRGVQDRNGQCWNRETQAVARHGCVATGADGNDQPGVTVSGCGSRVALVVCRCRLITRLAEASASVRVAGPFFLVTPLPYVSLHVIQP